MDFYKIITRPGLEKQVLLSNDEVIAEKDHPAVSAEKCLLEELNKQIVAQPRLFGYGNTAVRSPNPGERFPLVSIAHFFLADTLNSVDEAVSSGKKGKTIVELGSGPGFLGNYMANNFQGMLQRRIIFGALYPEAIGAAANSHIFNKGLDPETVPQKMTPFGFELTTPDFDLLDFRCGRVEQTMQGQKADITLACPFYIPEVFENISGVYDSFPEIYTIFGSVSKAMGANFYLAHTTLADAQVEKAARDTGATLTAVRTREFPFTLDPYFQGKEKGDEMVGKLLPLGLQVEKGDDGDKLSHKLRISKMEF